jgi:hypothetical protein
MTNTLSQGRGINVSAVVSLHILSKTVHSYTLMLIGQICLANIPILKFLKTDNLLSVDKSKRKTIKRCCKYTK